MTSVKRRNASVKALWDGYYDMAIDSRITVDERSYRQHMDALFQTSAWGFREILLVVISGKKMDPDFKASIRLYDCNPRAIYEGPLRLFLEEHSIPHRKSGPLNVAKATKGIDENWAAQRRPANVAKHTVLLVRAIDNGDSKLVDNMAISLLRRLLSETKRIDGLTIDIEPSDDPEFVYDLCAELINKTPDAGNTPQRIAALLLKNYHSAMNTGVVVTGEEDRASVTSTTSKKPGDVNEEDAHGVIFKVYEITVKKFDLQRIKESYDCLNIYNNNHDNPVHAVVVICRHEDCPSGMVESGLHSYYGHYEYQDMMYYFWDIFEWMASTLQRMIPSGINSFYNELNAYIADVNTAEKVKQLWKQLHE